MAFNRPPNDKAMMPQETKKLHRKQKIKCPQCHHKTPVAKGSSTMVVCDHCGFNIRIIL